MPARLIMLLQVVSRRFVAADVLELRLRHPIRPQLPAWEPGAHVDVRLPDGIVRQYSLCGSPDDLGTYCIAVKRLGDSRGGSRWIHENLMPGTTAHVSAPRNHFRLGATGAPPLFVAGGIGITPIRSMVHRLASAGAAFRLHYCARSEREAPYLAELRAACGPRLRLHLSEGGSRITDWRPLLADAAARDDAGRDARVYCCGPASMVEALQRAAGELGLPPGAVKAERFTPSLADGYVPAPFEAQVASTGQRVPVAADETLLDALARAGVAIPSACRIGLCGSCECGWLSGDVHHRDSCLEPEQRARLLTPCVSRGVGTVMLDL